MRFALIPLTYFVAVMTVLVLCCRPKEYKAGDGQCCPMCDEGSVVRRDCTTLLGTGCKQCENGTYMNSPNGLKNCWACTTCDKGHGLAVLKMCTTTSGTVCGALSGYFCTSRADETGCSFAEKHSLCSAGQRIKDPGTNRTDTVCESCLSGSFSTDGVKCTAWTVCSTEEVRIIEGSATSDVVCARAERHHYGVYGSLILLLLTGVLLFIKGRTSKKTSESRGGIGWPEQLVLCVGARVLQNHQKSRTMDPWVLLGSPRHKAKAATISLWRGEPWQDGREGPRSEVQAPLEEGDHRRSPVGETTSRSERKKTFSF